MKLPGGFQERTTPVEVMEVLTRFEGASGSEEGGREGGREGGEEEGS